MPIAEIKMNDQQTLMLGANIMMNKKFNFLFTLLVVCFCVSVAAQDMPQKEHEMLKMDEGIWDAQITMLVGKNEQETQYQAKEVNTMIGNLWSIGKLQGNIAGMEYEGFATLGYDTMQKKYVGTWIDSITAVITPMEGSYDEKTKTLTLFYTTYDKDGRAEQRKNIMIYRNSKVRDFTMFIKKSGEWQKAMKIHYTRT